MSKLPREAEARTVGRRVRRWVGRGRAVKTEETYDLVVIGGGTAGETAARVAKRKLDRVALVERERLGGDCLWYGCVPTKAMLASAKAARIVHQCSDFGIAAVDARLDFAAVMARKDRIVARIEQTELPETFRREGIDVLLGPARFRTTHKLEIGDQPVTADRFVIATGSRPAVPPIEGLNTAGYLTNVDAVKLQNLPQSLVVLGGGPIGCEFAQMFRRFGVAVTVVEMEDRLLPREDEEISGLLAASLVAEGIALRLGQRVTRVERTTEGRRLHLAQQNGPPETVTAEQVLVATGRTPRTDLNLEAAGVAYNKGGIKTDRRLRTTAQHIWAAGDVVGPYLFTHVAAYHGDIAGTNAAGGRKKVSYRALPWATFTDPEVARAGLTEAEARQHYGDRVTVVRWPLAAVDRALCEGEPAGLIKLVLTPGIWFGLVGGELVGAHIIGTQAAEWLHQLLLVMRARLPAGLAVWPVHVYPTLALGVQQALGQLFKYSGPPTGVQVPAAGGDQERAVHGVVRP
ncbi:MAG TPA: FAD-dependent oxidoreductase [Dehalococcoidia bacterium]|nr:FAD-dependent oxidoreductase [Dehalococcoidia bacterium]